VRDGNQKDFAGNVLLDAMGLQPLPYNFILFYELLSRAKDDALSLITINDGIYEEEYKESVIAIQDLQSFCITYHPFSHHWETFVKEIQSGRYISILASLARDFYNRNPKIFLEKQFLEKLSVIFSELINEVFQSELSSDLKQYLINQIEDIIRAIRRYLIDGSDTFEKVVKSSLCDLNLGESSINNTDKENSIFKKYQASMIALFILFRPTPWDLFGAIPDYVQFWRPTIEEFIEGRKKIEKIAAKSSNTIEIVRETEIQKIRIKNKEKNMMTGKEQKLLISGEKITEKSLEEYGNARIVEK
jgi:hypothetical protein